MGKKKEKKVKKIRFQFRRRFVGSQIFLQWDEFLEKKKIGKEKGKIDKNVLRATGRVGAGFNYLGSNPGGSST